jgi:hypothetical protein
MAQKIFVFALSYLFIYVGLLPDARANGTTSNAVVSDTDLGASLRIKSNWHLIVTHEPDDSGITAVIGNLHFCFQDQSTKSCQEQCFPDGVVLDDRDTCGDGGILYNVYHWLRTYPAIGTPKAALVVADVAWTGGGSGEPTGPIVWRYDQNSNRFRRIFVAIEQPSSNGEVRFIDYGPLAGDVILDQLTRSWPYRYQITVYRLTEAVRYNEVISYAGQSKEGDGNTLAVIDAEMPEIEFRLSIPNSFQKPPVIPSEYVPSTCAGRIYLKQKLEWCDYLK